MEEDQRSVIADRPARESSWGRAKQRAIPPGWAARGMNAVGAFIVGCFVYHFVGDGSPETTRKVIGGEIIIFAFWGLAGMGGWLLLRFFWELLTAPYQQRNEARDLVDELRLKLAGSGTANLSIDVDDCRRVLRSRAFEFNDGHSIDGECLLGEVHHHMQGTAPYVTLRESIEKLGGWGESDPRAKDILTRFLALLYRENILSKREESYGHIFVVVEGLGEQVIRDVGRDHDLKQSVSHSPASPKP